MPRILLSLLAAGLVSLRAEETVVEAPEPPKVGEEVAPRGPVETAPPTGPSPWAGVRREWPATRVSEGPKVDGRLDDEVWTRVPDGGPLVQADPFEGFEPSERTAFRVVYDDEALYIGFWCYDRQPERIVAAEMARDGRISADDYVLLVLDTMYDRRNGYEFRVNPNGARGDALISDNVSRNEDWNGVWAAAATVDAEGWKAEVAIPFATVSFNPRSDRWGFNVFRQIARRAEKNRWTAARREISTYNVAEAGTLGGLTGLKQGLGLDLTPYVLGRFTYDHEGKDYDATGDAGGDLRYRITPSLTALLSYNTDFAETEVDARQINLTRFPLFYPEKRDFFLEDSGIFRFGGLESALLPFYSRRIGLNDEGVKVPIVVAGKLTGRERGFNLGVVDALMDEQNDIGMRNAFVARVSRNVLEQSTVGGIVTYGDPNSSRENVLGGADFRYRTSGLFGRHVFEANAFGMATYTEEGENGNPASFGTELILPNDLYYAKVEFYQVGDGFNPGLGFAPRRDVRAYFGSLSYKPRPESLELIRQLYFSYSSSHFTNLDNELETAYHSLYPLLVIFESADEVFVNVIAQFDAPDEPFEIHPGVSIPAGEYWWPACRFGFETASKRPVEAEFAYTVGEFYSGDKQSYSAELDVEPFRYLTFRLEYSLNQVRLPQGDFDTQLASARIKIAFTPNMIWHNLVQYDNVTESIGYNSRFVWEFRPGADFFLVLNQNIDRTGSDLTLLESELTAKLGMTFRF